MSKLPISAILILLITVAYLSLSTLIKQFPESFSVQTIIGGIIGGYQESITATGTPTQYLIFSEENMFKAKNLKTNQIEFSNKSADATITWAVNAANGGKITLKAGVYPIHGFGLTSNAYLSGEGMDVTELKRAGDVTTMVSAQAGNGKIIIEGLTFNVDGGAKNSNDLVTGGNVEIRFCRFKRAGFGNVYLGTGSNVMVIDSEATELTGSGGWGGAGFVVESENPNLPAKGIFIRSSSTNNNGFGWHTENAGGYAEAILYGYTASGNTYGNFETTGNSKISREAERFAVVGEIYDSQTGDPIENASIQTNGGSGKTDSYGHYIIVLTKSGTYNFNASKEGYKSNTTVIQVDSSKHLDFKLEPPIPPTTTTTSSSTTTLPSQTTTSLTTSSTTSSSTTSTTQPPCDSQFGYVCKPNPCNNYPQPCASTNAYKCQDTSKWCCYGACSGTTSTSTTTLKTIVTATSTTLPEEVPSIGYKLIIIAFSVVVGLSFLGYFLYQRLKSGEYEKLRRKWK